MRNATLCETVWCQVLFFKAGQHDPETKDGIIKRRADAKAHVFGLAGFPEDRRRTLVNRGSVPAYLRPQRADDAEEFSWPGDAIGAEHERIERLY